uniref:Complement factor properdin n=1 Tax=Maylandia zebra TaxID=106582 RepID=A0A3P9DIL1_9CICH
YCTEGKVMSANGTVCLEKEDCPCLDLNTGSCEAGVLQCQSVPGCHVDGGWSQWGAWTECSLSCGGGVKFRRRLCDNPSPQSGGRGCLGDAEQQRDCNTHLCTVGPWLPWSQWSECSVSCGGGQQYRSRLCSLPCVHGRWNCSLEHCPVHGALSSWGPWSPCSLSCGGLGLKTRSKGCTQPAPARGGRDCQGPRRETTYCQAPDCPVDGAWTPWSVWSDCSATCGRGTHVRTRACINPPPRNNGSHCSGPEKETQDCQTPPYDLCPWSPWSPCSQTCGAGSVSRHRACVCEQGGDAAFVLSEWSGWTRCSPCVLQHNSSQMVSIQRCFRACLDLDSGLPVSREEESQCPGLLVEERPCPDANICRGNKDAHTKSLFRVRGFSRLIGQMSLRREQQK